MPKTSTIDALVDRLVEDLRTLVESESVTRARAAMEVAFTGGARPRAKRVSPQLRLNGRYMGLIKQVTGKDRERVRALRANKGVEAAIELMTKMAARTN